MDTNLAIPSLCNFTLADASKCNAPSVARGFCEKHYRALKRAGTFETDLVSKPSRRSDLVTANSRAVKRAYKKLLKNAPDYVDIHLQGARIAAQRGETKPAEWAILHTRTVEPIAEKSTPVTAGTTINIGVKVSGVDRP